MIDHIFKEQVGKNNILTNRSNVYDIMHLDNFEGSCELDLVVKSQNFGLVFVEVKSVSETMRIVYDNIVIFETGADSSKIVPLTFVKGAVLTITGKCNNFSLHIYGCSVLYKEKDHVMPRNKMIVSKSGNTNLFSYSSVDDVLENNLIFLKANENKSFLQTYIINNEICVGKLTYHNSVYFCNNTDNYTNPILIADSAEKAIFLQNYSNGSVVFIYITNRLLCCKVLDYLGVVGDVFNVQIPEGRVPLQLYAPIIESDTSRVFGVRYDNNLTCVYYIKDDLSFEKIFETKADYVRIIEKSDKVILVQCKDYNVDVLEFQLSSDRFGTDMLIMNFKKTLRNVVDYYVCDDCEIVTSVGGVRSMVKNNE